MKWPFLFLLFLSCSVWALENEYLEVPGFPKVPKITHKILLPFGSEVGSIDFVYDASKVKIEKAELEIVPFPKPLCSVSHRSTRRELQNIVDEFYPKAPLGNFQVVEKHGYRILYVNIYPALYHLETKRLFWITDGELRIDLRQTSKSAQDFFSTEKDRVEALLLAEDIGAENTYPEPKTASPSAEYLIIGPKEFEGDTHEFSIQRLMAEKRQRGISAKYVAIEEVLSSEEGASTQEKIRNSVKRHYQNEGTRYLLLIGNGYSTNPTKILTVNMSEGSIPSDLYFGCLDGDFKKKPYDMACEVAVGRAPAGNVSELRTFVRKSLILQGVSSSDPLIWNTVNFGEKLDSSTYASMSIKMLETGGTAGEGIPTQGYPASAQFFRLYETPQKTYSGTEVLQNLSLAPFYTLNHMGHCQSTYCLRIEEAMIQKVKTTFPFFGITQGCFPGNMKRSNWASKMVLEPEGGAGALIANSNYGWYWPGKGDGPSNRLHMMFYDSVFREGQRSLGKSLYRAKERLIDQAMTNTYMEWVVYQTNLFGDPEVQLKFPVSQ